MPFDTSSGAQSRRGKLRIAKEGADVVARRAREAFIKRFELLADPEGKLTPEDRATKAAQLLKTYMNGLAVASAKARKLGDGG